MANDFTFRRQAIIAGAALLVLADVALAFYSWRLASSPHTPQRQFEQKELQRKMLQGDIDRAQKIRNDMPNIKKDCDQFERSLPPASSGYSSVTSDLGGIARKSGSRLEDLAFRPTKIENRGTTEVLIDATVSGDYKSIMQFLNGVQRSTNYEVDTLSLATENANQGSSAGLKVSLHLKTYFRTAA
jgi:type IV pilus assembly protein PilO